MSGDAATYYTVDQLEDIVKRAIRDREWEAVGAAIKLIAMKDARRAEVLLETIQLGLAMNQSTDQ